MPHAAIFMMVAWLRVMDGIFNSSAKQRESKTAAG
jgi:hypothetical protein